jgi:hypothetical protein
MSDFSLIGAWLGILGGITGVLALTLQISSFLFTFPKIKIDLVHAYSSEGRPLVNIAVRNIRGHAVALNSIGIEYANGNHSPLGLFPIDSKSGPDLPVTLDAYSEQNWLISKDSLIEAALQQGVDNSFRGYGQTARKKYFSSKINL